MKKTILRILVILILIGFASFIILEGLIIIEGSKKTTDKVDYVIVLGARLYGDRPSPALLERLKVAKDYLMEDEDIKVVVTGGQGIDEKYPKPMPWPSIW